MRGGLIIRLARCGRHYVARRRAGRVLARMAWQASVPADLLRASTCATRWLVPAIGAFSLYWWQPCVSLFPADLGAVLISVDVTSPVEHMVHRSGWTLPAQRPEERIVCTGTAVSSWSPLPRLRLGDKVAFFVTLLVLMADGGGRGYRQVNHDSARRERLR